MHRFFVDPQDLLSEEVPLTGDVYHHLAKVLRLAVGAEIFLLDGTGNVCLCRILEMGKREGRASVLSRSVEKERGLPVRLLQGIPKGEKMDLILQKGTELGITLFAPVSTSRSASFLSDDREGNRMRRWHRIVTEAARQSRRPVLPPLLPPANLEDALGVVTEELRLMLWEGATTPLSEALQGRPPASAALLVGPEGGFDEREAERGMATGFLPVSLGPRILRTETAGFAVTATLQYLYGDLGGLPGDEMP